MLVFPKVNGGVMVKIMFQLHEMISSYVKWLTLLEGPRKIGFEVPPFTLRKSNIAIGNSRFIDD